MNPATFLQCLIDNLLRASEESIIKEFLGWKDDPCFELENSKNPSLKLLAEYQNMIWYIKRLEEDSEELKIYKNAARKAIKFFKEI